MEGCPKHFLPRVSQPRQGGCVVLSAEPVGTAGGVSADFTWRKAASRRLCLEMDRAHTVSQRVLSSCTWTLTQEESSWLPSMSSRAERFRACTLLVLFPSSFWKTWDQVC